MDPVTIALATFGIQKLRGKSTKRSLRDAAIAGGIGQLGGMAGIPGMQAFGSTSLPGMTGNFLPGSGTILPGQMPTVGQQFQALPGSMAEGIKGLIGEPTVTNEVTGPYLRDTNI
ncbi:MAG: hypothetical protein ACO3MB_12880 [Saprospiraceae bacterium]